MKKYWILIAVVIIGVYPHSLVSQESSKSTIESQGQMATGTLNARQAFVKRFGDQLRKEYQAVQKEYPLLARYVALQEVSCPSVHRLPPDPPPACGPQFYITEAGFGVIAGPMCPCERATLKCLMNPDPDIRCGECGVSDE